ncbi:MAG: hypothetical protein KatS3mg045_0612 [Bellilinea sp.]|nr:MAG: hypothetical protein KatS3mg045_0612 [Bellilinea sp.]
MTVLQQAFIGGTSEAPLLPLGRYLPLLPSGMVGAWLKQQVPAGAWLLDPIGSHPQLALEAARAGYRILIASNNPILSFMLEILASSPSQSEFEAALAALAASKRGEERLERHILNLYLTPCAACGQLVSAQAFIWQNEPLRLISRIYRCPHCGDEGERPATPFDLEKLQLPGNDALHRARALSRVIGEPSSASQEQVNEALKTYLPRPLYVLTTLINKIETLSLTEDRKRLLTALLIQVCDEGNTLWQHPSVRPRPRQLTIPTQFRENNLWLALENAVSLWCSPAQPVQIAIYPQLPKGAGISLFRGRISALPPSAFPIQPAALISILPRPNQAFWTLCALWSGWLWGREAVQPLRGALERRRYDWYWMSNAVQRALRDLSRQIPAATPFFALASETTPGFLLAAFLGPLTAGFSLNGFALERESELAQFHWQSAPPPSSPPASISPKSLLQNALKNHLEQRGQPARYLTLFAAALCALMENNLLPRRVEEITPDLFSRLQTMLGEVLEDRHHFIRYGGHAQTEESGTWWLAHPAATDAPLADRVEKEIVRRLVQHKNLQRAELESSLYPIFPGLLVPSQPLITAVLESYALPVSGQPQQWQLRPEDEPARRRADLINAAQSLKLLGERMGFRIEGDQPIGWLNEKGETAYLFFLLASSIISPYVFQPHNAPPSRCVLVLPGSRTGLVGFKLRRDPRLSEAFQKGWRLLKFRHLRNLSGYPQLSINQWDDLLNGDPPQWEDAVQMRMF